MPQVAVSALGSAALRALGPAALVSVASPSGPPSAQAPTRTPATPAPVAAPAVHHVALVQPGTIRLLPRRLARAPSGEA